MPDGEQCNDTGSREAFFHLTTFFFSTKDASTTSNSQCVYVYIETQWLSNAVECKYAFFSVGQKNARCQAVE